MRARMDAPVGEGSIEAQWRVKMGIWGERRMEDNDS
jgi:hypothetical protein